MSGSQHPPFLPCVCHACWRSGSSRKAEAKEADRLAASGTKEDLARALSEDERGASSKKKLLLTRLDRLLASHLPTNYDRWLEQNVPYRIM